MWFNREDKFCLGEVHSGHWFQLGRLWSVPRRLVSNAFMLKMNLDKAYDKVEWSFISEMLSCVAFGSWCVAMVNTLFTNTLAFVSVNNSLSLHFSLHHSSGCPLASYLYMLTANALGYLLEATHIAG
jgi:hypothetical protein